MRSTAKTVAGLGAIVLATGVLVAQQNTAVPQPRASALPAPGAASPKPSRAVTRPDGMSPKAPSGFTVTTLRGPSRAANDGVRTQWRSVRQLARSEQHHHPSRHQQRRRRRFAERVCARRAACAARRRTAAGRRSRRRGRRAAPLVRLRPWRTAGARRQRPCVHAAAGVRRARSGHVAGTVWPGVPRRLSLCREHRHRSCVTSTRTATCKAQGEPEKLLDLPSRRPFDAQYRVQSRRHEDVHRRRLAVEQRRGRGLPPRRDSGIQSRWHRIPRLCIGHSQSGRARPAARHRHDLDRDERAGQPR